MTTLRQTLRTLFITTIFATVATAMHFVIGYPAAPASPKPAAQRASDLLAIPQAQLLPNAEGHWTKLTPAEAQALRQAGAQIIN